jgi:uncharacterized membrane protein YoaK (UPF0700 family)
VTRVSMTLVSKQQFALGLVAGYCDTVSFIALGGLFVAHVTGNLVLAGASVFSFSGANVIPNLMMLPMFLLAIGLLTLASRTSWFSRKSADAKTQTLLLFQLAFSLLFWATGTAYAVAQFPIREVVGVFFIGSLGVTALAAQNALTRLTGSSAPATTVMTGNLTQAAVSSFALLALKSTGDAADREKETKQLKALGPSVAGFFVGAALAAPLTYWLHFHSMSVACVVLATLLGSYRSLAKSSPEQ